MNISFIFKNYYLGLLLLLSILSKLNSEETEQKNFIIIPFKSYFPKIDLGTNTNNALINSWIRKKIYLEIENESKQKMHIILNKELFLMHTRDVVSELRSDDMYYDPYNKNVTDICNFNYKDSNSYQLTTEFNRSFYSIPKVCYAKEKIYLYNDFTLKSKNLYDIEFIHSSNETNICFFCAFELTNSIYEKKLNLFYELKNLINSNSYSWTLKFTSPDDGYLIFGDIIGNNKLEFYNDNIEENYISLMVSQPLGDRVYWKIYFDKIFFGDYAIIPETYLYFFIDYYIRYITVPRKYFNDIKSKYMLNNENLTTDKFICFEELTESYYTVYCNKNDYLKLTDNYQKLPTLNLFGHEVGTNITFTAKDLFLEKGDKIYFYIASKNDDSWHMGSVFLEKYIVVFNNEEKLFSILSKPPKSDLKEKNNTILKIVLITVLVFILTAFIFAIVGLLFGKKLYQNRKKKANELDDDEYDYSPQSINTEDNRDNNNLINN